MQQLCTEQGTFVLKTSLMPKSKNQPLPLWSSLAPYKGMQPSEISRRMGHEFIGVVEAVGKDVHKIKVGDLVAAPRKDLARSISSF